MIDENKIVNKGSGNNVWYELKNKILNKLMTEVDAEVDAKVDANQTQIEHKPNVNNRINWVIKYLEKHSSIKSVLIQNEFSISKEMASRDLKKLINQNIIVKKGSGNNVWYELKK
ncbi:MAG: hypothetical protein U9N76_08140 [Candidatus Marinimicrobia bacterium]|nr:hypothetical protein [Candidatus Neomarinimicrobiota bacterium]